MSTSQAATASAAVLHLLLDDGGSRTVADAPRIMRFAALHMQSWQVFAVAADSRYFPRQDAYLIKINYDLVRTPGMPTPSWFEVTFAFSGPGADPITVIDALPRHVDLPQGEAMFALDERLDFVPGRGIKLPAVNPQVDIFGIGGNGMRWRFISPGSTGVREGSYTGWATVVVAAGCPEISVVASARFDFVDQDSSIYRTTDEPVSFPLRLNGSAAHDDVQPVAGDHAHRPRPITTAKPRVFVSYTHDDWRHIDAVLALSNLLMQDCGLDVHMDRWGLDRRRDWYLWAIEEITSADFVLIIASEQCKRAGQGPIDSERNRGMQVEMSIVRDLLQDDRATWLPKLLPVVLPGRSVSEIPIFLQPRAADHYIVTDFSRDGAADLIRALTASPNGSSPA